MRIAGTGHRPDKLGGYSTEVFNHIVSVAEKALKQMKVTEVISGMALGWDMALAQAALNLNIPLIAAVPFKGQELKWNEKDQKLFNDLLSKAKTIQIVCEGGYSSEKMQKRNEWMVDNCHVILAAYNGDISGGTYNCIKYAKKQNKPVINIYKKIKINE